MANIYYYDKESNLFCLGLIKARIEREGRVFYEIEKIADSIEKDKKVESGVNHNESIYGMLWFSHEVSPEETNKTVEIPEYLTSDTIDGLIQVVVSELGNDIKQKVNILRKNARIDVHTARN